LTDSVSEDDQRLEAQRRVAAFRGEEVVLDPLEGGQELIFRCGWVYETNSERGYFSGEFLLRSDSQLFTRSVWSLSSNGRTRWEASAWTTDKRWTSEDAGSFPVWAGEHLYSLVNPSPVPTNQRAAGPFDGYPDQAKPFDLESAIDRP